MILNDKPLIKRVALIPEVQYLLEKSKNLFVNLSNLQAKQIANAISNIQGFAIRKYGYNLGNISIPLLINNVEKFSLNDTGSQEIRFYPETEGILSITCGENFTPQLNRGEYIRIYTQIDNNQSYDRIFKTIPKNTQIGVYTTSADFQCSKENFGRDLDFDSPFKIEIINTSSKNPKLRIYSQYYSEEFASTNGSLITTSQWADWNWVYPYFNIDLTNETQGIKFELYHKETNTLVGNAWAYPGNKYVDGYMGSIYHSYPTDNYKLVISNI